MELQEYIREIVERVTADLASAYRRRLTEAGKQASGALAGRTEPVVTVTEQRVEGALRLATYWRFVEGGGKGNMTQYPGAVFGPWRKYPPREAIEEWIRRRGITPGNPETTEGRLAFLIARKIYMKGIKPCPCLEETITARRQEAEDEIGRAVERWGREAVTEWFEGLTEETRYR